MGCVTLGAHEGGWIDEKLVKKYIPPPAADTTVWVCGLPAMYEALCGGRAEAEVAEGSILARLGFESKHVEKF